VSHYVHSYQSISCIMLTCLHFKYHQAKTNLMNVTRIMTIAIIAGSIFLNSPQPSNSKSRNTGMPLRPGSYYASGTYITIIGAKGKFCYRGGSKHGVTIASLNPNPKNPNEYRIFGWGGVSVVQKSRDTLVFAGRQEFKYDGGGDSVSPRSPRQKACLKSKGNYNKSSSVPVVHSDF
jgi:hypothetical protein